MNKLHDSELIFGIRNRESYVLEYIYKEYFPLVVSFVEKSGGSEEVAKDIFQESLIIMFKRLQESDFKLEISFQAYFNGIFKHLWYNYFQKTLSHYKPEELKNDLILESYKEYQVIESLQIENSRFNLMYKHLMLLKKECIELLKLFFSKIPLKEIAEKMGFKSENYIKKRKHYCKEALIERIKSDPSYTDLQ